MLPLTHENAPSRYSARMSQMLTNIPWWPLLFVIMVHKREGDANNLGTI